jgi:hypothetical protein
MLLVKASSWQSTTKVKPGLATAATST